MCAGHRKYSFPPSADADARILVLGSMPGEESLRMKQYYAHKRNSFWIIMGQLFGFPSDLPYAARLAALRNRGVALWDVLAVCSRKGSLDSAITDPVPNDIPSFLKSHKGIRTIFCNGTASYELLRKNFPAVMKEYQVVRLPSSSPAHASLDLNAKLDAYKAMLRFL